MKRSKITTALTIERFKEAHPNKNYDYSLVDCNRAIQKVSIICPEHGVFIQEARKHWEGKGCPDCGYLKSSGFGKDYFVSKSSTATLYAIQCTNENESFIKLGITTNLLSRRFSCKLPYSYKLITKITGLSSDIYDLESNIKEKNNIKIIPKKNL